MEVWAAVEGTNGKIEVSNAGRVRSLLRGKDPKILKAQKDKKGYLRVRYAIDREKRQMKVHRAVAKAFLDNPNLLPQVNHIDGNKENNAAWNLEWVTNAQNVKHAMDNGLWDTVIAGAKAENDRRKKSVIGSKDGNVVWFESVSDAERQTGTKHVSNVLKGQRTHANGWTFRYAEGVKL